MTFKIDTDIPVPEIVAGARAKYPLREMGSGHSFFVPGGESVRNALASAVQNVRGRRTKAAPFPGTFAVRRWEQDGVKGYRVFCLTDGSETAPALRAVS